MANLFGSTYGPRPGQVPARTINYPSQGVLASGQVGGSNALSQYQEQVRQKMVTEQLPAAPPEPKVGSDEEFLTWGVATLAGGCGVANICHFNRANMNQFYANEAPRIKKKYGKESIHKNSGGCGFAVMSFIDSEVCKKMYLQMKEWFPILYQSPIRVNDNSMNRFFFCIFDTGEKERNHKFAHLKPEGFENGLEW